MHSTVPTLREMILTPTKADSWSYDGGSVAELPDGRLLLGLTSCYGHSIDSPADIRGYISADGGSTWGPPFLLQANVGLLNVTSVSLLAVRSGELLMGFLVRHHASKDCRLYVRLSADAGHSWTEPVCATPEEGYYSVNNGRLVQTKSGRLLAPAAKCLEPNNHSLAECFYSDDVGRTWIHSNGLLDLPGPLGASQPGVVECADGSLLMYVCSEKGRIYTSRSLDGGELWSDLEPTDLVAPTSACTAAALPASGDILMLYNDRSAVPFIEYSGLFERCTPLSAAVSHDCGRTWEHRSLVENNDEIEYCYPNIAFIGTTTLLTYSVHRLGWPGAPCLKVRTVPTVAWTA